MAKRNIRSASERDAAVLAALKETYLRTICRGFLPCSTISDMASANFDRQILAWIGDPACSLDVLDSDDHLLGYIVYGADESDPSCGLLRDAAMDLACVREDVELLVHHALDALTREGYTNVHQWVLRDNFRLRYALENNGFRADGSRREMDLAGQRVEFTRYLYRS